MSLLKTSPCSSSVILTIALSLMACDNNDDITSSQMDATSTQNAGAAEEIRGTVLNTTTNVADKVRKTTTATVKKTGDAVESKLVEPSRAGSVGSTDTSEE